MMAHTEYRRLVPGAETAVLFIHGIVGTPDHFRLLIPLEQAVPEDWSVCNLLLPGHGGTAEDFAASSRQAWKSHVWNVFQELAKDHERVILVGHSMGTLFALRLAVEFPEKIGFLFLLGVPLRPHLRIQMAADSLRMVFGILPGDHVLWKAGGVTLTRKLWKYLGWVPRFLDLFREISETEKLLSQLKAPCVAWQSKNDELVSNRTRKVLMRQPAIQVRNLPGSTHYSYAVSEKEAILKDFEGRIKKISHD